MSLLPQQKKSADEIAKLRESFGMVGPPPATGELPVEIPVMTAASAPAPVVTAPEILESPVPVKLADLSVAAPAAPLPVEETPPVRQVRSLRRSERFPVLPVEESGPPQQHHHPHAPEGPAIQIPASLPAPHSQKAVRSLRKSEQIPLAPVHPPAPDSKLPIHRHSDKELNEIRRHDALAAINPAAQPPSLTAHPVLIVPGYLFAIAGAVCFHFYDLERQELRITVACAAIALLIAGFILFKKPLSRHHAAFIGVITLFVIIFGALHYFPQLRYGT